MEGVTDADRKRVKDLFDITYRRGMNARSALGEMDAMGKLTGPAATWRKFMRKVVTAEGAFDRGLCPHRKRRR
jgi:hypothetical protein